MQLAVGDYIYHPEYGIGVILAATEGEDAELILDFENQKGKVLPVLIVQRRSQILSLEGYRVLAFTNPTEAQRLLVEDPVSVIEKVLNDFPYQRAKTEEIKDYLHPYFKKDLDDWDELDKWWEKAQPQLKQSSHIDTSKSHIREYGLRLEELTPAEEAYFYFQKLNSRPTTPLPEVYDAALKVLNALLGDKKFSEGKRATLANYFLQLMGDNQTPLPIRFDCLFRLEEARWAPAPGLQERLDILLTDDVRLYQLDIFAQNRLAVFLAANMRKPNSYHILASGICPSKPQMIRVQAPRT